ncbi:MAG: hypothetical protein CSA11_02955 [Chloroflexi bacterium]|nr:MAG: hypothetical protein CSA11_02955 [Chloroflexota bacterium]
MLFVGVILRLRQYFAARSLWLDESMLALNIINRSYAELLEPLDYAQAAPLLFLWIEKTFMFLGGTGENVLRFFPLFSSLAALFLFPLVARKYMSRRGTLFALAFFVLSSSLIYFSSELKQYASDVFAIILGLYILSFVIENKLTNWEFLLIILGGCFLLALSHPSVFVLASNCAIFLYVYKRSRSKIELLKVFFIAAGWGLTFLLLYFISLANIAYNPVLSAFWRGAYPPAAAEPWQILVWFGQRVLAFIKDPGHLSFVTLVVPFTILGIGSFIKRNVILSLSLILPVLLTLTATALYQYPFSGRLLLFLTPILFLFLGEGIDALFRIKIKMVSWGVGFIAFLLILYHPMMETATAFLTPPMGENIEPAIQYIADNWREGDQVYIYYSSKHPFEYYQDRFSFADHALFWGTGNRNDWPQYLGELEIIPDGNGRLWLLFSHVYARDNKTEEAYIIDELVQSKFQKIDEIHEENAAAYLLELKN